VKRLDNKITAVPHWDKTADQIWNERFAVLTDEDGKEGNDGQTSSSKIVSLKGRTRYILSVAAAILVIITTTAFIYSKDINAVSGEIVSVHLPDGSIAQLSTGTSISYRPMLWIFSPCVTMSGEAYFTGSHAEGFSVKTKQGEIEVLGTSFNSRTYDDKFVVTCIEGKVKVKNLRSSVELTENMESTIINGKLKAEYVSDSESAVGWTKGVFSFYNKPLNDVLKDVARYYDVKIEKPEGIDTLRYTGKFSRQKSAEEVLTIIGQPYGLTFKICK